MNEELLINASREAMERAYCPYSNFRVGAALLTNNGSIITGGIFLMFFCVFLQNFFFIVCNPNVKIRIKLIKNKGNVENASYGATICAERSAIVRAIAEGYQQFKAIAICTNLKEPASPCGICRQFLAEFGDMQVSPSLFRF